MGLSAEAFAQAPLRVENGDEFGSSTAVGDFDGDRLPDLAVGVPGKGGARGIVLTFRGSVRGLEPWQMIEQGELGASEMGDQFGMALIAGDFDGDGRDDLAVGAPGAAPGAPGRMEMPTPRAMQVDPGTRGFAPQVAPPAPAAPPAPMAKLTRADRARGAVDGRVVQAAAADAPRAGVVFVYRGTASGLAPQQSLSQALLANGMSQAGDHFGAALAAGDFDGDRIADLAVGAPGDAPTRNGPRSGFAFIFRGTRSSGLMPARALDAKLDGLVSAGADDDDLGSTLAAGDFDGDRIADLAVGAPGKAVRSGKRSGLVLVFRGKMMDGLQQPVAALDQEFDNVATNEEGDSFGTALAAADFDRDGIDDLVVGAPGEAPGDDPRAGFAFVFRGTRTGFKASQGLEQELSADRSGMLGTNVRGDEFGSSLAAGDFDGDGNIDLAVGVPGKSGSASSQDAETGVVTIFRGSRSGLQLDSRIQQNGSGLAIGRSGDRFGASLAAGDFDRDGRTELAVGAPGKAVQNGPRAGFVFEFAGTPNGLRADQRLDPSGSAVRGDDLAPAAPSAPMAAAPPAMADDGGARAPDEQPARRQRRDRMNARDDGNDDAGNRRNARGNRRDRMNARDAANDDGGDQGNARAERRGNRRDRMNRQDDANDDRGDRRAQADDGGNNRRARRGAARDPLGDDPAAVDAGNDDGGAGAAQEVVPDDGGIRPQPRARRARADRRADGGNLRDARGNRAGGERAGRGRD